MFIKTEFGHVINTQHYFMFEIVELENTKVELQGFSPILLEKSSDATFQRLIILGCNNKEYAEAALDNICRSIENGARLWDADIYKKFPDHIQPYNP